VLLTLVPLVLAAVVTLQICVALGMPMNFANIIALPLLLGVGVAFKIYYIMAWRDGQTNLLQTSLTRAVFYSALTTATAFGSLWFSSHPCTSSMGELLALSLICTLAAAVLFQPVLMGRPREAIADGGPSGIEPPPRPVEFAPAMTSAAATARKPQSSAAHKASDTAAGEAAPHARASGNGAAAASGLSDDRVAGQPEAVQVAVSVRRSDQHAESVSEGRSNKVVPAQPRDNDTSDSGAHKNGAALALDGAETKDGVRMTADTGRRRRPATSRRAKVAPTRKH
jgi:hypothetical protein